MSLNNIALGEQIQKQRKNLKMTQNTLADLIDCGPTYVSYIENGKRSMSLETFVSLANALETTADELLKDSLCCFHTLASREVDSCLSDCNIYESRIIMDVMKATKQSLRNNMRNGSARRS